MPHRFGTYDETLSPAAAPRARILVVDPDDDTRSRYREWFQTSDCDVIEAADGRDALTKALVRPPALVVTETRLPFIDGYALCEILRVDQQTVDVPILVVRSDARASELARIKTSGANAVLVKPIAPEQMLAETRRLLVDGTAGDERVTNAPSDTKLALGLVRRRRLSRSFARVSTGRPPLRPPAVCPICDRLLTYKHSHLGGVSERQREQWDWYVCPGTCGTYEYRHRTRHLRQCRRANNAPLNGDRRTFISVGDGSVRRGTIEANGASYRRVRPFGRVRIGFARAVMGDARSNDHRSTIVKFPQQRQVTSAVPRLHDDEPRRHE